MLRRHTFDRLLRFAANLIIIGAVLTSLYSCIWEIHVYRMNHPPVPVVREDKIQVACIGDSITYGAGVSWTRSICSYPACLQRELGSAYHVQNYGLNGKTLLKSGNEPYCEKDFYRISHEQVADIYLIMLGTNDSKGFNWNREAYIREMTDFVKSYQRLEGAPRVYLLTPPDCFEENEEQAEYKMQPEVIAGEVVPALRQIAEETGVTLIDIYALTKDKPAWLADKIHPNFRGNREIAVEIADCIKGSSYEEAQYSGRFSSSEIMMTQAVAAKKSAMGPE